MLSSVFAFALLQTNTTTPKPASSVAPLAVQWKTVVTKIGATLSTPIDLGKASVHGASIKNPSGETYTPKLWNGAILNLSRKTFADEDPKDSTAVKLEDVVYGDLDLDEDRISKITFGVLQG